MISDGRLLERCLGLALAGGYRLRPVGQRWAVVHAEWPRSVVLEGLTLDEVERFLSRGHQARADEGDA